MPEQTDRERLAKLAAEKQQAREEAVAKTQREETAARIAAADLQRSDEVATKKLFERCQATFDGHTLTDTNHVVDVSMVRECILHNLSPDGVPYVSLNIWWFDPDNGVDGKIPLTLARVKDSRYHVIADTGNRQHFTSEDESHERMMVLVAEMGRDRLRKLAGQVRNLVGARRLLRRW